MTYREDPRLGRVQSAHVAKGGSYLGAAIMSVVMALGFGAWAFTDGSLRIAIGVLVMLGLGYTFFEEWRRMRAMLLVLHEGGISMRTTAGQRIDLLFEEMVLLEARYVPGMWKKGLADEGNRVSLHVASEREHISIPRELEGFSELGALLVEKTKLVEKRLLVQSVNAR
jgi:hypothetical protein